jgi:hypothetical protein
MLVYGRDEKRKKWINVTFTDRWNSQTGFKISQIPKANKTIDTQHISNIHPTIRQGNFDNEGTRRQQRAQ